MSCWTLCRCQVWEHLAGPSLALFLSVAVFPAIVCHTDDETCVDQDLESVRGKRDQQRREKERLEREKQQRLEQLRSQVRLGQRDLDIR